MFSGVNYEINIANEPGCRIENLTWPDGTPVADDDEFDISVNNYRATSQLLSPGIIFEEGNLPSLLETDVRGDIGGVRNMIIRYIIDVKGGILTPECDGNWHITGISWDEALHRKAVELLKADVLVIPSSEDGKTLNIRSITEEDLQNAVDGEQDPDAA